MRSLCKQLENCSALNMHAASPSLLTLTSWSPQLQAVAGPMGGDSWRSVKTERGAVEAFGADKVGRGRAVGAESGCGGVWEGRTTRAMGCGVTGCGGLSGGQDGVPGAGLAYGGFVDTGEVSQPW